jgi:hypothetical protein
MDSLRCPKGCFYGFGDYDFARGDGSSAWQRAAITDAYETTDANHGRIEVRRHVVVHDVGWLFGRAPD